MARQQAGGKNRNRKPAASPPGRLRIVAGNWRNRVLEIADVPGLRPTPERVRETLFNWLSPGIFGKRCLDLFAGTGALGFEALSRGARQVEFVEKSGVAMAALRRNATKLEATGALLHHEDAGVYIARPDVQPFDVVFLDPPFADDRLAELCRLLDQHGLLSPAARIYLEQDRAAAAAELPDGWAVLKEKNAGNVRYSLVAARSRHE